MSPSCFYYSTWSSNCIVYLTSPSIFLIISTFFYFNVSTINSYWYVFLFSSDWFSPNSHSMYLCWSLFYCMISCSSLFWYCNYATCYSICSILFFLLSISLSLSLHCLINYPIYSFIILLYRSFSSFSNCFYCYSSFNFSLVLLLSFNWYYSFSLMSLYNPFINAVYNLIFLFYS